jgi:hypothetical protein
MLDRIQNARFGLPGEFVMAGANGCDDSALHELFKLW